MALAVLDPGDFTVKWHNEYAQRMLPEPYKSQGFTGLRLTDVLPIAHALGATSRLLQVAENGDPHHMATHVVGVGEAGRTVRASAYRLPSGELLLVTDQR